MDEKKIYSISKIKKIHIYVGILAMFFLVADAYILGLLAWALIEDPRPCVADITQNQKQTIEEYNKEAKELREAIRLNPNDTEAHRNLGNVLYYLEQYDEAEKEFREVIKLNPNDVEAHHSLGVVLYDLGKYEEAKIEFGDTIKIYQNHTCFE